mmetsp:Transcript_7764/g.11101  ORF Transcript_7764/g.11101 Transcript_7764/m.11101 type:complete len:205 (+) Transcript_7764:155-769(+)|eukprot:CAMPEP_0184854976 /NCGR_PEP_ID=MMETSP0580-20130426/332_1 /TAXON_ID=1118495 /ORGANISM="Dactyliosolen fragilissimus" /LENGTH=204 /DNA_ID=CAMNT_0027349371 /DNA_START=153 /DNA_END=767 /DNA_ORIENTATION=+
MLSHLTKIASTRLLQRNISTTTTTTLLRSSLTAKYQNHQKVAAAASFSTDGMNVMDAWEKSCYHEMDFTISENDTVYEAVQKFSAYDVGALVTTDEDGKITGVISERDYIKKIALLGRTSKETKIKDIFTQSANLVTAKTQDSVDLCMSKMMSKSIRHLPILDEEEKLVGMVSIKDLIKAEVEDKEKRIRALSDFALGKSAAME